MKKLVSILLTITFMTLFVTGCSSSNKSANPTSTANTSSAPANISSAPINSKAPMKVVLASQNNPGTPEVDALMFAKEQLEKRSNGAIICEVYPGGTIGNELELVEQIKAGTVHVATSGHAIFDKYAKQFNPWSIPYLFPNEKAILASLNGKTGNAVREALGKNGIILNGFMFRGNRQLTTNRNVSKPDDIKGMKIRLPETSAWIEVWKALGCLPVPIPTSEVFGALQTGVVEAQENPISSCHSKGLWEVQKYLVLTNHIVDFNPIISSKKWFDSLSDDNKKLITAVLDETILLATNKSHETEAKLRKEMEDKGMKFLEVDTAPFRERTLPALEIIKKDWVDWLYDEALKDSKVK